MKKKSREQEIQELQEKVFGKNAAHRRTFSVLDADTMMQEARKVEASLEDVKTVNEDINEKLESQLQQLEQMTNSIIESNTDADLDRLQKEIENDFGVKVDLNEGMNQIATKIIVNQEMFNGMLEDVEKEIVGQTDFLKKLILGFRRPHVLQVSDDKPFNTILIHGPKGSGKHYALERIATSLQDRKVIISKKISYIDLSLYSTQEDEKLFMQDIFTALKDVSSIVAFENVELCFPAYLTMLANLFVEGKIDLKKRYVINNEQLVETNTALMKSVVRTLEAKEKYLVLLTNMKKNKIVDLLGADFINSIGDIVETKVLDEKAVSELTKKEIAKLIDESASKLNITLTVNPKVNEYMCSQFIASEGAYSILSLCEDCFKALTQYKLELLEDKVEKIELTYKDEFIFVIDKKKSEMKKWLSKEDPLDLEDIKKELDEVIGLDEIKKYVLSLEDNFKIQVLREQKGLKNAAISKHMIFTGNPGTGKTTIARLISKYLRAIGVLSGGQLVEVTRADLVGRYVGHTAPLTMQVIKSALGGVLFIDEAYSLYRGKDDSFGLECIDTIVKGIEDYRDNLIVILAGYKQEMEVFLTSNSGLKSRFPNTINFEDYAAQELLDISKSIAKSKDYKINSECDKPLLEFYDKIQKDSSKMSGNGRLARNKVEEAILKQSTRLLNDADAIMDELRIVDFRLDESSFVE